MATISLSTYSLRIKDKSTKNYLNLDSIGKEDFFNIFTTYLKKRKTHSVHDIDMKRLMKCNSYTADDRQICGIIETGEYGFESELINVNDGKKAYHRKTHDAEVLPFYFLIEIPKKKNECILILQRFKQFGIRKFLRDDFKKFFNELKYNNLTIEIDPLIPKDLTENLIKKGEVTKIRLISYNLPRNLEEYIENDYDHFERDGYMEIVLAAKRYKTIPIKKRLLEFFKKEQPSKFIEFKDYNYQDVKIELKVNNTKRTFSFLKPGKINPSIDITNNIDLQESGHPVFRSIDEEAKSWLEDVKESIK